MRQQNVLDRIADIADEAMPPIIECIAETGTSRKKFKTGVKRIETEIVSGHRDRSELRIDRRRNGAAIRTTRSVDLVVHSPDQIVHDGLNIELAKTRKDLGTHVTDIVSIRIFQIPQVGCGSDKYAAVEDGDPGWPGEITSEDRTLIENAIVIGVDQQTDFSNR